MCKSGASFAKLDSAETYEFVANNLKDDKGYVDAFYNGFTNKWTSLDQKWTPSYNICASSKEIDGNQKSCFTFVQKDLCLAPEDCNTKHYFICEYSL